MIDILHRVGIGAPIQKVYRTLTRMEANRPWWDSGTTGDGQQGGVITFFKNVDMQVVEATPTSS
jgi:uncharacterized protein YndB with AHSA1/START domain